MVVKNGIKILSATSSEIPLPLSITLITGLPNPSVPAFSLIFGLATYHENARIEIGCDGQLLSKNEFATRISQLMSDYPTVKLVNPSVDVSQKKAVVKVTSTEMGDENHVFRIEMLKENERWYIIQESCY